ncbi:hypothetical protein O181_022841 [Austropuccinia psidii MF-1]|uniref:Uncharacterized protein n=1 Tax=Austropuccinia psidii MF-1 TaxID=1389203 RepID=A0A9Q3CI96_9BASI|nr:hypothetical protein [Austropuccinia psidii MF-1]
MEFKCQINFSFSSLTHSSSFNHMDFVELSREKKPTEFPTPSLPCKKALGQPAPGPSGTQWSENLFHEHSQHDEPPMQGLSQSSEPHEDVTTSFPALPGSVIIIDDMPVGSPPPLSPSPENPTTSSPQSHNEAWQDFTELQPTLMIPQAIIHESINQILMEHH